jgi:hypothetical protein
MLSHSVQGMPWKECLINFVQSSAKISA